MIGSAVPATVTVQNTPASPSISSRLRGLSYLRNYTREYLPSSGRNEAPAQPARSTSPTFASPSRAGVPPVRPPTPHLEDSLGIRDDTRTLHVTEVSEEGLRRLGIQRRRTSGPIYADIGADRASPAEHIVASSTGGEMARGRAASARLGSVATASAPPRTLERRSTREEPSVSDEPSDTAPSNSREASLPTIRFIPHVESRSSRPSLLFSAVSRKLKQPNSVVRVGRYSERDTCSTSPSSSVSPVGFKSKVVSRRHCEFWYSNGQWYVKDVKSSSGTFLNHVRLSSAGTESRPYPVNDGDVVQLGIDFKGGEDVIFRCVKIRIECNRGWQKSLNNFNTTAHQRLLNTSRGGEAGSASANSSDCSICLSPVAPCQALFVAPCSHVWHYKCIRNLVHGPNWPNFLCPNCRLMADLEADVEPPDDLASGGIDVYENEGGAEGVEGEDDMEIDVLDAGLDEQLREEQPRQEFSSRGRSPRPTQQFPDDELAEMLHTTTLQPHNDTADETQAGATAFGTRPVDISNSRSTSSDLLAPRSATPTSNAQFALAAELMSLPNMSNEGAITPRNAVGPFVFDGNDSSVREL